jgi:YD repeat-containing protein
MRHNKFFLKISRKIQAAFLLRYKTIQLHLILKFNPPMKNLFLLFLITLSLPSFSQYYYKDLVSSEETGRLMKTYLLNKVSIVLAAGYDPNGVKTNDFDEKREVLQNGTILKTTTRHNTDFTVSISRFSDQHRLLEITDSSAGFRSVTMYDYDASGKISSIRNNTKDSSDEINPAEIHFWFYNATGQPVRMIQVINGTDSTEYKFQTDENGNVMNEQSFRKGNPGEMIYYYYDDKNRLTDIVRYNERLKKLLPDYMFEYDENDHVIQKLTTLSNMHLGYLIWRYAYNDRGLKTKEALYNKDKVMTGKIEYSYTFSGQ